MLEVWKLRLSKWADKRVLQSQLDEILHVSNKFRSHWGEDLFG